MKIVQILALAIVLIGCGERQTVSVARTINDGVVAIRIEIFAVDQNTKKVFAKVHVLNNSDSTYYYSNQFLKLNTRNRRYHAYTDSYASMIWDYVGYSLLKGDSLEMDVYFAPDTLLDQIAMESFGIDYDAFTTSRD